MTTTLDALRGSWKFKLDARGLLIGLGATHAVADRTDFERKHGVSFCRRCGVLIEWDARPTLITAKTSCPGVRAWSWPLAGREPEVNSELIPTATERAS